MRTLEGPGPVVGDGPPVDALAGITAGARDLGGPAERVLGSPSHRLDVEPGVSPQTDGGGRLGAPAVAALEITQRGAQPSFWPAAAHAVDDVRLDQEKPRGVGNGFDICPDERVSDGGGLGLHLGGVEVGPSAGEPAAVDLDGGVVGAWARARRHLEPGAFARPGR